MSPLILAALIILAVCVPALHPGTVMASWQSWADCRSITSISSFKGTVLAGTAGGLIVWEGGPDRCRLYGRLDGLPSSNVTSLAVSADGRLVIGTDKGLVILGPDGLTVVRRADGLADDVVNDVAIAPDGRILVATLSGLSIVSEEGVVSFGVSEGLVCERLLSVLGDSEGGIWVGTGGFGAARLFGGRVMKLSRAEGLCGDYVYDISLGPNGRILLATDGGLGVWDGESLSSFVPTNHLLSPTVWSVDAKKDLVLCGGQSGLFRLGESGLEQVTIPDRAADTPVLAVAGEDDGTWLVALAPRDANDDSVLLAASVDGWLAFKHPSSPLPGPVSSICGSDGAVWVGLLGAAGGLSVFDRGAWHNFDRANSPLERGGVSSILPLSNGVFLGTQFDGVWALGQGGLSHFGREDGLASDVVATLAATGDWLCVGHRPLWDGYWFRGGGASVFDGQTWYALAGGTPLEASFVNAICGLRDGSVLFGTGCPGGAGEVVILGDAGWSVVSRVDGLGFSRVVCGVVDAYGRVLLGTESSGVLVLDGQERYFITSEQGLVSDSVTSLAATSWGPVICGCDATFDGVAYRPGGVCVIEGSQCWRPAAAQVLVGTTVTAIWLDEQSGQWWFGTSDGQVICFRPAE